MMERSRSFFGFWKPKQSKACDVSMDASNHESLNGTLTSDKWDQSAVSKDHHTSWSVIRRTMSHSSLFRSRKNKKKLDTSLHGSCPNGDVTGTVNANEVSDPDRTRTCVSKSQGDLTGSRERGTTDIDPHDASCPEDSTRTGRPVSATAKMDVLGNKSGEIVTERFQQHLTLRLYNNVSANKSRSEECPSRNQRHSIAITPDNNYSPLQGQSILPTSTCRQKPAANDHNRFNDSATSPRLTVWQSDQFEFKDSGGCKLKLSPAGGLNKDSNEAVGQLSVSVQEKAEPDEHIHKKSVIETNCVTNKVIKQKQRGHVDNSAVGGGPQWSSLAGVVSGDHSAVTVTGVTSGHARSRHRCDDDARRQRTGDIQTDTSVTAATSNCQLTVTKQKASTSLECVPHSNQDSNDHVSTCLAGRADSAQQPAIKERKLSTNGQESQRKKKKVPTATLR